MKLSRLMVFLLLGGLLPFSSRGESNILDLVKARELPQARLQEYVLTLDESAMLQLANEAFEKGWSSYAVGVGILGSYYESKGLVFTMEKKLAILKNPRMHPAFRELAASWGLKDRSAELGVFLQYADTVLAFFEDEHISYFWKQGIPENAREALQGRVKSLREQPDVDGHQAQAVSAVFAVGSKMIDDLIAYVKRYPGLSPDIEGDSASYAVVSLSEFVGWYLGDVASDKADAESRLGIARRAQAALSSIVTDESYCPQAARMVLKYSDKNKLEQVLSAKAVAAMKNDPRFAALEDQQLLDSLSGRVERKQ